MGQQYLDETPTKHKIIITRFNEDGNSTVVQSALPDNFGFTVGSEFGTPFDTTSISQMLQKVSIFRKYDTQTLNKFTAKANVGQKLAFTMDKGFLNPQPTEISFEMEFNAYYSAMEEVLLPMIRLLHISLGSVLERKDAEATLRDLEGMLRSAGSAVGVAAKNTKEIIDGDDSIGGREIYEKSKAAYSEEQTATVLQGGVFEGIMGGVERALQFVKIIRGPAPCSVQFGDVYTFSEAFISSVGVKFSNKLDITGIPLSGTASVTCLLKSPPVAQDLGDFFGDRWR